MSSSKLNLLVTNDDGPRSPMLGPLCDALEATGAFGTIRVVVPAEEQSWIGQAVTRFRPLFVSRTSIGNRQIHTVSGSPADCVGLGLHNLFEDSAELVVSGINVGTNASLPFYLNSGTVGAARQALVFGARGISLSALMPSPVFHAWREDDMDALRPFTNDWKRLAEVSAALCVKLIDPRAWKDVDLYSLNLPWEATKESRSVITELERTHYKPLYELDGSDRYSHQFHGFYRNAVVDRAEALTDFEALDQGFVSITPLRYALTNISQESRSYLETL